MKSNEILRTSRATHCFPSAAATSIYLRISMWVWGEKCSFKWQFYEELDKVFHHFPKYHMKILLGDINAKIGRQYIFKPTVGN
jgi:hypothetical protein